MVSRQQKTNTKEIKVIQSFTETKVPSLKVPSAFRPNQKQLEFTEPAIKNMKTMMLLFTTSETELVNQEPIWW